MRYLFITICFLFHGFVNAQNLTPFNTNSVASKWGYQDSLNRVVIYPHFDEVDSFNEFGLARVRIGNYSGILHLKLGLLHKADIKNLRKFVGNTACYGKSSCFIFRDNGLQHQLHGEIYPVSPVTDFQLIRFEYPRDSGLYKKQWAMEVEKELTGQSTQLFEGFTMLVFNAIIGSSNRPENSRSIYIEHYFKSDVGSQYQIGIGLGYSSSTIWSDKVYNHRQTSLGLLQRLNLTDEFAFSLAVYPIMSTNMYQRDRGSVENEQIDAVNKNLSSRIIGNINLKLTGSVELNFGATYMPTYKQTYYANAVYANWGLALKL